jgi:FHA domain
MPTCPTCHYERTLDADACVHCKTLLRNLRAGQPDDTRQLRFALLEPKISVARHPSEDDRAWTPGMLALYIDRAEQRVIIALAQQVILGRYTTVRLGVDLERYQGWKRGVSRTHAVIRRATDGLTVQELLSSNGTWLNGVRLRPFLPSPLHPGDRLRLGLLSMTIGFEA